MKEFNFEVTCHSCNNKFKYGSRDIVIECGFEGVRCPKCGNWIYHSNDNTPNHPELFIARDKDGSLWLHGEEPVRKNSCFVGKLSSLMELNKHLFPEVTWENSPKKVKIELLKR